MSTNTVEELVATRDLITFLEIASLLHDVGKLDDELYRNHCERAIIELGAEKKINLKEKEKKEAAQTVVKTPEVLRKLFSDTLLKNFLKPENLADYIDETVLGDPIFRHHEEYAPSAFCERVVQSADFQDSAEDKGAHEEGKTQIEAVNVATPFGFEYQLQQHFKEKAQLLNSKYQCDLRSLRQARQVFYEELAKLLKEVIVEEKDKLELTDNHEKIKHLRNNFYALTQDFFSLTLAESRRPANDIILFDHCYMVAAIAKAIFAACVVDKEFTKIVHDKMNNKQRFCFKVMKISFHGKDFLTSVNRLPDFIGRKNRLNKIRTSVKEIIEYDLPIGNLIYEDSDIMCFLVADIAEVKEGRSLLDEIKARVTNTIIKESNGVLFPLLELIGDEHGQASTYIGPLIKNAKNVSNNESKTPYTGNSQALLDLSWVKMWKNDRYEEKCYVCGYAPGETDRTLAFSKGEKLCSSCKELRLNGIKERRDALEKKRIETFWLDELRDESPSNRIAIVIGKIGHIEEWLSGELVQRTTKTVYANPSKNKSKAEKLSQIKGIFKNLQSKGTKQEVIDRLILDVQNALIDNPLASRVFQEEVVERTKRKEIIAEPEIDALIERIRKILADKSPSPSRLRRVWREFVDFSDKSETIAMEFLSKEASRKRILLEVEEDIEPNRLGKTDIGTVISYDSTTLLTADYLDIKFNNKQITEYSDSELNNLLGGRKLSVVWSDNAKQDLKVKNVKGTYHYIPLLTISKTAGELMLLCPARYAMPIAKKIEKHFNKRFEKALGKLNLNIGMLYFKYRYPLYQVLDAGKRVIKEFEFLDQEEKVVTVNKSEKAVHFDDIDWLVSMKLDNAEEDRYYTYFKKADTNEYDSLVNMVDQSKLKIYPSWLDFECIDSSEKKFNLIAKGNNRKRIHATLGTTGPRPYLLSNVNDIEKLWTIVCKLSNSQIEKIKYICSSKRAEWFNGTNVIENPATDQTYQGFVETTVYNVCKDRLRYANDRKKIVDGILSGMFFDVVELFLTLESYNKEV